MKITAVAAIGAFSLVAGQPAFAQTAPIVVELYTSQGCSSCPPADKLLKDLAEHADVLPLALHVDYWDYIGWKDTFASPQYTARQKAYAAKSGHRTIYTPQMIIGGSDHVIGYVPMDVSEAIRRHQQTALPLMLVAKRDGNVVTITASPSAELPPVIIVQVVRYRPREDVAITRGENAGQSIEYVNIVTAWQRVAEWDGKTPLSVTAPVEGSDSTAVILQEEGPGQILAAALAQ